MPDSRLDEVRQMFAELKPAELSGDQKLVDDELAFRLRFGLGFSWPRRHRESLIKLKHELDLTDAEIRVLRYAGNLHRTSNGIRLNAGRARALLGWTLIGIFVFVFGTPLARVLLDRSFSGAQVLVAGKVLLLLIGLCTPIYLGFVYPWALLRRRRALLAAAQGPAQ